MQQDEVIKQFTTPLGAPAFPVGPYRFHNREYLNILYRTDIDSLRKIVPEPLEITDPLVRFEIMKMPDVTGLGSYTECGQVIPVSFNGEEGEYLHAMYVDSHPAIASGREIGAYPKKLGKPNLFVDSDTLVGTLDYSSLRVATATMGYKHCPLDLSEARKEICKPNYMIKKMPGYDGYPRICELVRSQITDITIHGAWSGPARLELFAHALAPMSDLPVHEVVSTSHILTDLTLASPRVVHDYLASK
ncbi:acetoacetate decarboxylase [Priestia megaterium]|jgi:acetoacetate decarboxylase|uniref:acetoacetate decarboxylase n=1 Tax=Priestia megaterium TaxID=1404 RepID=UPI00227E9950|nr:acetoacetate decarboxylase [Priestia megaterium]MCY9016643.1 acetoacetate decarboxylase [Priestia megaterium]MCY9026746.1 acetoacetate decarboxylase [Priestia megaterium]